MHQKIIILTVLSLILLGCRVETSPVQKNTGSDSSVEPSVSTASDNKKLQVADAIVPLQCPSGDFEVFLKSYVGSLEVQKLFTSIPLESISIDPLAEPEPSEITRMLGEDELNFPLLPNLDQQTEEGLKSRQSRLGKNNVEVIMYKPDTDYQMSFFFRQEKCWKLYRIKDHSL